MTCILKFVNFFTKKHEIYNSQNESYLKNSSCYLHEFFNECYSWYLDSKNAKRWKYIFPSSGHIFSVMVNYTNLIIF